MRVETEELMQQALRIRFYAEKLARLEDEVLRVTRSLGGETFGERFEMPLRSSVASIGERRDEMMRLSAALSQIVGVYERNERTLEDEAEAATVHNSLRPFFIRPLWSSRFPPLGGLDD